MVKTEKQESFSDANIDSCCQAFADGDQSLRDSCETSETVISTDLVYDPINMCRI